jgi:hypothetical protein
MNESPLPSLPARTAACPPAIDLEQLAVGVALPALEAHVKGCSQCLAYVAQVKQLSDDFVRARPAERFLGQLEAREQKAAPKRSSLAFVLVGAAGLAASVAVGVIALRTPGGSGVTFKGGLWSIASKRGDSVKTLDRGATVTAGDALRFAVKTERPGHAVVLERDGLGKVTVVAPFNATAPQRLVAGTTVLEDSAVLDGTPGAETFVTIFSEHEFELAPLVKLLEANRPVTCDGCTVETSTFDKR